MGCVPSNEIVTQDNQGNKNGQKENNKSRCSKSSSRRNSILITREDVDMNDEEQRRSTIIFENVNWKEELKTLIQTSEIEKLFAPEGIAKIKQTREEEEMKIFLDKEKEEFKLGMKMKLIRDMSLGSIHVYYTHSELPFHPEDFIFFNLFQDEETRNKIDKKCIVFDILAVVVKGDVTYLLIHSMIKGNFFIKGKETLYIKGIREVEVEGKVKYYEANVSVEHFSIPEKSNFKRMEILEAIGSYEYFEDEGMMRSEYYCKVIPKTSVGVMLIKPFLSSYTKEYNKKTVKELKEFKEKNPGGGMWKERIDNLLKKV